MWELIFVFKKLDRAAILRDPVMDRGLFSYWQAWNSVSDSYNEILSQFEDDLHTHDKLLDAKKS